MICGDCEEPMKPYYEHAGITIYHGDCREVIPTMEVEAFDLIVTDPPYGVKWQSNARNFAFEEIAGDDSVDAALAGLALALPKLKNNRHAYVFGRYDMTGLPVTEAVELIWDKGIQSGGDVSLPWGKEHEYIQFVVRNWSKNNLARGDGRLSARLRKGSVLRVNRLNAIAIVSHPTEKPVRLLRELIESSSCIGESVLDIFAGCGSTLVAARMEGRQAVGIEIEERYCEIAARRLSQEVLPLEVA